MNNNEETIGDGGGSTVNIGNIDEIICAFLEKIMKEVEFNFEPSDFSDGETVFGPLPTQPLNGTIVKVYLNGVLMKSGLGNDYQLSIDRQTITFEYPIKNTPAKPGRVTVFYVESGL